MPTGSLPLDEAAAPPAAGTDSTRPAALPSGDWRTWLTLVADVAAKASVVGLALYPLLDPTSSHFTGKAMGFRALAYPAATLIIPGVWLASRRPRPYPVLADTALAIPFALDAAGNVFGLFDITGFDVIPHSVGWLLLSLAFGLAVTPMTERRPIAALATVGFGATIDILWEIGEYLLMKSGSSGLQLTYDNTIQDLSMSLLGAGVAGLLVASVFYPRPGTPRTLFGWRSR